MNPGDIAPDIDLENFSLHEALKSGPVLLVFFKISCPTCQFTLPFLERLHARGKGPRVAGISQDDAEGTKEFMDHFGITLPVFHDPARAGYPASNAYGLTHVPSLFLVNMDGRIAWALNGFHKAELENLGSSFGGSPFAKGERVPAMRPG